MKKAKLINRIKTQTIIMLATYIVCDKLNLYPIETTWRAIFIIMLLVFWALYVREKDELGKISYLSSFLIPWFLAM